MKPERKIRIRTCVVCGKKLTKDDLTRLVRLPDGTVTTDSTGKMPGRGVYLCKSPECADKLKPERLKRALRTSVDAEKCEEFADAARQGKTDM